MSDIHVGKEAFSPELLKAVIEETNELEPDLVAVAGDLTMEGHLWEFETAKQYLDRLECPNVVMVVGNKDAKNVVRRHFKDLFGPRERAATLSVREGGGAKVVALDLTRMDLDVREVGLESCSWLDSEFRGWDQGPKILILHHHILAVPGTGLDSAILSDAGDVMAILRELEADMILCGHRHVPYLWSISGVRIIHSGTASTMQTRGIIPPSYNFMEFGSEEVHVTMRQPGKGKDGEQPLASFARHPTMTSRLYPELEWFVHYD